MHMNQILKTIYILMGFFFLLGNLKAQEKELFIKYDLTDPTVNGEKSMEVLSKGEITLSSAVRKMAYGPGVVVENGSITYLEGDTEEKIEKYHVFKDASQNLLLDYDAMNSEVIIKETLDLFQWKLTNEKDTILGYICQQAKTHFRGRDYTLWFTTQLPFKAAPWKFHGLPGVVLKASSDDNFFMAEAISLEIRKAEGEIKNPYANEKPLSWDEFKKQYIKKDKAFMAQLKAKMAKSNAPALPFPIASPRKEIILEKNRYTMDQLMEMRKKKN